MRRKQKNAVAELRDRLDLTQQQFGSRIERSTARVRQIEEGARISTEVRDRLIALAMQHGYQDLVDDFIAEHETKSKAEGSGAGDVGLAATQFGPITDPRRVRAVSTDRRIAGIERRLENIVDLLESLQDMKGRQPREPAGGAAAVGASSEGLDVRLSRIEAVLRSLEARLAALEAGAPPPSRQID